MAHLVQSSGVEQQPGYLWVSWRHARARASVGPPETRAIPLGDEQTRPVLGLRGRSIVTNQDSVSGSAIGCLRCPWALPVDEVSAGSCLHEPQMASTKEADHSLPTASPSTASTPNHNTSSYSPFTITHRYVPLPKSPRANIHHLRYNSTNA
jgi:hypothetical protein